MPQFYELIPFLSLPSQIYEALTDCSNPRGMPYAHAKFQLGLCHLSGFGTEPNYVNGLGLIQQAAADGTQQARTLMARLHRAFGISVSPSSREMLFSWLSESARQGSRIAVQDLRSLFPERSLNTEEIQELPGGRWVQKLRALCNAVRKGEEVHISPQDTSIGPQGDTILHWCVFFSPAIGVKIATLLMRHGCSPATVTRSECIIGNVMNTDLYRHVMPSRTTAIDWAIIVDNLEVLKVLVRAGQGGYGISIESPAFTTATCAARYQRFECLRHVLESGYDMFSRNEDGPTPMLHAIRPNLFERIMNFSEGPVLSMGNIAQQQTGAFARPPVFQREIDIIKLLQKHGASLRICQESRFNCLHVAVGAQNAHILEYLLRSADMRDYINEVAEEEWSSLGSAISLRNERAIKLLLAYGAHINQVSPLRGYSALHVCALYPRYNSARVSASLIKRSCKLINHRSKSGFTALHYAAMAGSVPLMNTLAERRAHLLAASNSLTPLGFAIAYWSELGVEEMCKLHAKNRVPLVAAFDPKNCLDLIPLSFGLGPLAVILAPGRRSTI